MTIKILEGDNLSLMKEMPSKSINLIYADCPFNTKKKQSRKAIKAIKSDNGNVGFGNEIYERQSIGEYGSYNDNFDDFVGFMVPRLVEAKRLLKPNGSIYIHLDYREVHYIKIEMDKIFGRDNFINEIVWCYDYGAKSKSRWSTKHDNILFYAKDKDFYTFNIDKVPRIPYMSPALVGPEKAARGKLVTDWWQETIVPTNSREKQNYATQKPLRILRRIVDVSSNEDDLCLDFFAGSGSFGAACKELNRNCILIDNNKEAIEIMKRRLL